MEQGKHVIFYRQQHGGEVLIFRILHQRPR
jgi:plasmid stabilization system protein ParE